jgi:hypothetical protein
VIGGSHRPAPVLFAAGLAVLVAAWVVGEPPFGSPDENAHYLRALSIPSDGLVGEPDPTYAAPVLSPEQLAVVRQEVRVVTVPPGLSPQGLTCHNEDVARPADCLNAVPPPAPAASLTVTPIGTYPPALYVLPGLAARLAGDPVSGHLLGSAASAATAVVLLALAVALVWRPERGPASLVGLAVATTPMVLYVTASLNPSGPEIAAGIALGAALLRLARAPTRVAWATVALAGAVLVLSRSVSPAWLAVHLVVFGLLARPAGIARLVRAQPLAAAATGLALAAALAGWVAWTVAYGTDVPITLAPLPGSLVEGVPEAWTALARDSVLILGYLQYGPPLPVYLAWQGLWLGLIGTAFAVGDRRQRLVLLACTGVALLAPLLLQVAVMRHTGFVVQGRHVLPVLVLAPLVAGDVVADRAPRWWPVAVGLVVAAVHFAAWYTAAHRAAVGVGGPWLFLGRSAWSPPLGYGLWMLAAGAGALLVATALASAPGTPPRAPEVVVSARGSRVVAER